MSNLKNVMITGASAGIGKALAFEFASRGHGVLLLARRQDLLNSLKAEICSKFPGARVVIKSVDVTDEEGMKTAVRDARSVLGPIDTVIANAGFGVVGNMEDLTTQDVRRQFEVNVFGALNTLYSALDDVKAQRGRICLVGSTSSYLTVPTTTAYCMSKFAVRSLAEGLYAELACYGVSVTLINPGFINTDIRRTSNEGVFLTDTRDPVPRWLMMPAEKAARQIYDAVLNRRRERAITFHSWLGILASRWIPGFISFALKRGSKPRRAP